jgi:hypothetical protein
LALLAVPRDELPAIAPAHCRRRSSLRLKNTILATAATATKQNTSMLRYKHKMSYSRWQTYVMNKSIMETAKDMDNTFNKI